MDHQQNPSGYQAYNPAEYAQQTPPTATQAAPPPQAHYAVQPQQTFQHPPTQDINPGYASQPPASEPLMQNPPPPMMAGGAGGYETPSQNMLQHEQQQQFPPPPQNQGLSQQNLPPPPPPPPPRRHRSMEFDNDPNSPVHYIRDPHKLIAYLVPFPKPEFKQGLLHAANGQDVPLRFLIYTPPPPPLTAPKEGEKEGKAHKIQRKWQDEVRQAKTSDAKVTSWKGVKGRATKGISKAMNWTKSSGVEFLNRVPDGKGGASSDAEHSDGAEGEETKKTVGLEEMVLIYPNSLPGTEEEIRENFVNNMLSTKSKAQRDAIIATGLMPVAFGIDVLATVVWPFGGLVEIDAVWGISSMRGAKTARSVTKRLNSSKPDNAEGNLKLTFTPSERLEVLRRYLVASCHEVEPKYFKSEGPSPTESQVLDAIGWSPSQLGDTSNWEDDQWQTNEVKEDLRSMMKKGAKEYIKFVKSFEKDPEKALKKA